MKVAHKIHPSLIQESFHCRHCGLLLHLCQEGHGLYIAAEIFKTESEKLHTQFINFVIRVPAKIP